MVTEITEGVKVSVETIYQPEYSNPANEHFMFAYKVNIENLTEYSLQLLNRHWQIFDSSGAHRKVDGEGVVGQQPVLEPGQLHQYVSGCNLKSGIGKMMGTYQIERVMDGSTLQINIPEFTMIAPIRLN